MKALLLVTRVWNMVSGKHIRPHATPEQLENETTIMNHAIIDEANKKHDDFEDVHNKAACLITKSILDSHTHSFHSILEDTIATWNKLKHKFARKSEMGQEIAQIQLLNFHHVETERAVETIERFGSVESKESTLLTYFSSACLSLDLMIDKYI